MTKRELSSYKYVLTGDNGEPIAACDTNEELHEIVQQLVSQGAEIVLCPCDKCKSLAQ